MTLSVLASPILAGLTVGVGVPIALGYIYGVVPISLCRSGGCATVTNIRNGKGVNLEFVENGDPSAGVSGIAGTFGTSRSSSRSSMRGGDKGSNTGVVTVVATVNNRGAGMFISMTSHPLIYPPNISAPSTKHLMKFVCKCNIVGFLQFESIGTQHQMWDIKGISSEFLLLE